jgi:hypothetical protein
MFFFKNSPLPLLRCIVYKGLRVWSPFVKQEIPAGIVERRQKMCGRGGMVDAQR